MKKPTTDNMLGNSGVGGKEKMGGGKVTMESQRVNCLEVV